MRGKGQFVCFFLMLSFCSFIPRISQAVEFKHVNARSAILYDMSTGKVLFEQNADELIPPASLTKILSLYLTFEAIESGQISLSDSVRVSRRAASMPKVRMGLRTGDVVSVAQLIRGMAVESGNDAAVAMAEHLSGSVESFVARMNAKARELGMTNSRFMTPNGLPASGQLTTARDILKLSIAYIRRFPEALSISSLRSYTYNGKTDHNPNNLLGRCPGVDGLKTGFVCASGFNISATAMRDNTRVIAVVLGAQSPGVRCIDAENMIEEGYSEIGGPHYAVGAYPHMETVAEPATGRCRVRGRAKTRRTRLAARARANHAARGRRSRVRLSRAISTKTRAKCSVHAGRTAPRKVASRRRGAAPARTGKHGAVHQRVVSRHASKKAKVARAASHRKTARACSSKSSTRPRGAHRRTKVKTAIKKRRRGASHARAKNRSVG